MFNVQLYNFSWLPLEKLNLPSVCADLQCELQGVSRKTVEHAQISPKYPLGEAQVETSVIEQTPQSQLLPVPKAGDAVDSNKVAEESTCSTTVNTPENTSECWCHLVVSDMYL
jgi:hypothetical protein